MIHRTITKNVKFLTGYHTQEWRHTGVLSEPIPSTPDKAWLGVGYYFWLEEEFAHHWGIDSKIQRTGHYDVYTASIDETNILNASFNEKVYFKFVEAIEKTLNFFESKGRKITLLQVNKFLTDEYWYKKGVKGIIFDDLPHNKPDKGRIYSVLDPFYYKKRIQLVAFDLKIIHNFAIFKEELC